MSDHGYCGRVPVTAMQWAQARTEEMYARADEREKQGRFDVLSDDVEVVAEPETKEAVAADPVTQFDRILWTWQESDDATDRRLHLMTPEQREGYDTAVQTKVNARTFAKRFERWVDDGCPLDEEG